MAHGRVGMWSRAMWRGRPSHQSGRASADTASSTTSRIGDQTTAGHGGRRPCIPDTATELSPAAWIIGQRAARVHPLQTLGPPRQQHPLTAARVGHHRVEKCEDVVRPRFEDVASLIGQYNPRLFAPTIRTDGSQCSSTADRCRFGCSTRSKLSSLAQSSTTSGYRRC